MELEHIQEFLNEIRSTDGNVEIDKIEISEDSREESIAIQYWNKYGFKRTLTREIPIIE